MWNLDRNGRKKKTILEHTKRFNLQFLTYYNYTTENIDEYIVHLNINAIYIIFSSSYLYTLLFIYRLTIQHAPSSPSTRLHIENLQVSDDDTYLCESTYLEPLESCDTTGAYIIKLNIYGKCNKY